MALNNYLAFETFKGAPMGAVFIFKENVHVFPDGDLKEDKEHCANLDKAYNVNDVLGHAARTFPNFRGFYGKKIHHEAYNCLLCTVYMDAVALVSTNGISMRVENIPLRGSPEFLIPVNVIENYDKSFSYCLTGAGNLCISNSNGARLYIHISTYRSFPAWMEIIKGQNTNTTVFIPKIRKIAELYAVVNLEGRMVLMGKNRPLAELNSPAFPSLFFDNFKNSMGKSFDVKMVDGEFAAGPMFHWSESLTDSMRLHTVEIVMPLSSRYLTDHTNDVELAKDYLKDSKRIIIDPLPIVNTRKGKGSPRNDALKERDLTIASLQSQVRSLQGKVSSLETELSTVKRVAVEAAQKEVNAKRKVREQEGVLSRLNEANQILAKTLENMRAQPLSDPKEVADLKQEVARLKAANVAFLLHGK